MKIHSIAPALALAVLLAPSSSLAQEPGVKVAAGDFGIGIGDVPRLDGLRLNFRDRYLERVRGLNATLWMPYEDADESVEGLLLGIPLTGAADMKGLAIGFGVGIERDFSGIALAPIGMGAGGRMRGLIVGGVGVGGGSDLDGIMIGGVGGGIGGNLAGIAVGGIGVGVGCGPMHVARARATKGIDRAIASLVPEGRRVTGYRPSLPRTTLSIRRVFPIRTARDTRAGPWMASISSRVSGLTMLM